jgi:hypothetical protein
LLCDPFAASFSDAHEAIEILKRRAAMLDRGDFPAPGWTVSSFWFDQLLAFASIELTKDQFAQFAAQWQQVRSRVCDPKLTVWLDVGDLAGRNPRAKKRHDALAHQLKQPGVGPVLTLRANDFAAAVDDVVAAMAAMQ